MQDKKIITAFDALVRSQLFDELQQVSYEQAFQKSQKILLIRSMQTSAFERLLHRINEIVPGRELLVIGKKNDAEILERYWKGAYQVIAIDGNYNVQTVAPFLPQIGQFSADTILFFSREFPELQYMNIYEAVTKIEPDRPVFCCDIDGDLSKVTGMAEYLAALRLHTALGEWFWQRYARTDTKKEKVDGRKRT